MTDFDYARVHHTQADTYENGAEGHVWQTDTSSAVTARLAAHSSDRVRLSDLTLSFSLLSDLTLSFPICQTCPSASLKAAWGRWRARLVLTHKQDFSYKARTGVLPVRAFIFCGVAAIEARAGKGWGHVWQTDTSSAFTSGLVAHSSDRVRLLDLTLSLAG